MILESYSCPGMATHVGDPPDNSTDQIVVRPRAKESRGYWFWGPVALVIFVTEILGMGKVYKFHEWPTISTTIGHLQDRQVLVALLVVALVTLAAFYAIAYQVPRAVQRPEAIYVKQIATRELRLRYGAWVVYGATGVSVAVALWVSEDKIVRGFIIYGILALSGIVIPFILASPLAGKQRDVAFPNLFYTFACLRDRFKAVTAVVVALLAILVLHLALYPWPDLARESARYAGLNPREAQDAAVKALGGTATVRPKFVFSTAQKLVWNGENAWLVHFHELVNGRRVYKGCYVAVAEARPAEPSRECLT